MANTPTASQISTQPVPRPPEGFTRPMKYRLMEPQASPDTAMKPWDIPDPPAQRAAGQAGNIHTFSVTSPDGEEFKIEAPDETSALDQVKKLLDTRKQKPWDIPDGQSGQSMRFKLNSPPPPQGFYPVQPPEGSKSYKDQALDMAMGMTPYGVAKGLYDAARNPAQAFQTVDDTMRLAASGLSFGFIDKAAGYLNGTGTKVERARTNDARDRQGLRGMATELLGSVLPVGAAAKAGVTATRLPGLIGSLGGMAADGAGYGLLNAAGNDQDLATGALTGASGGLLGQAGSKLASLLARPVTSRLFPERAASRVLDKTMRSAKMQPWQVGDDLSRATADSQSSYAVMDSLGHPGQRLASTIARSPGNGRTAIASALENRQAGQGRRLANALSDGFAAPDTAAQRIEALTKARSTAADVNYSAARTAAGEVDVRPAVTAIDDMLHGNVKGTAGIASDTIEAELFSIRDKLANADGSARVIGFDEILRLKQNLDDAIETASRSGKGNRARMLAAVRGKLDASLEAASGPYKDARNAFRQGSKAIDAVETGRAAATRGRFEDTIPAFGQMTPAEQSAFRAGYSDPLIASTQQTATGVNKARPLINDATSAEFPAFAAPGKGDQLGRRIAREQTMYETRNAALGGSKTADNLADEADLSVIDPSVIGNLLSGNIWGAGKSAVVQALSSLKGQPASVREKLAAMLLETDPVKARAVLENSHLLSKRSTSQRHAIVRALLMGGLSSTNSQQQHR